MTGRAMLLLGTMIASAGCSGPKPLARETRLVMGTTAEIEVVGLSEPGPALAAAFAAIDRIDDSMSLWKESELQRLNDAGEGAPSPDLRAVLDEALEIAAASGGGFDPTVEPLVRATGGFGSPPLDLSIPERTALLARIGYRRIHVDKASGKVRLESGTRLDLGGVAKGYAVDRALAALRAAGAEAGVVSLGESSVGLFGTSLDLEVRDPQPPPGGPGKPWAVFRVRSGAVSTSGSDQRGLHILDPRSGDYARGVLSVTVLAATGVEADALSTAAFVLGKESGLRLIEQRGAEGFILLREAGASVVRATRGFADKHAMKLAGDVLLRDQH